MDSLLAVFGEAFEDHDTYGSRRPSGDYLRKLLNSYYFVALIAKEGQAVIGGLAAYELKKFEQERSEKFDLSKRPRRSRDRRAAKGSSTP